METAPGARPPRPVLVIVSGPPGSGKTTLARQVARAVGCPAVCRDDYLRRLRAFAPLRLDAPTIEVDTTSGYRPALEEVIAFAAGAR